ncbi:helix-turn-helix protein [Cohnella phaseoli]|uniref:Helix-turn-helix protein n=1 Tax=Cohnella phaseoli TaxID=456490 RepID=A0A3D9JPT0_9BACL|nr:helix-turn-helix protein [Cohnella phaseoli]
MALERTYSPEEVARLCDVTVRTVYDWNKKGLVVGFQEGKNLRFRKSDFHFYETSISLRKAAIEIDVPLKFLIQWVEKKKKLLSAPFASNTKKYFVDKMWLSQSKDQILEEYRSKQKKTNEKDRTGKKLSLFKDSLRLFDSVDIDGSKYRITNLDLLEVIDALGQRKTLANLEWQSAECLNRPYIGYEGRTEFRIPKSNDIYSVEFFVLERLVYYCGIHNVIIYENSNYYLVVCRNCIIPYNEALYAALSQYVIDGYVWVDGIGNIVLGEYEIRLTVPLKYSSMLEIENILKSNLDDSSIPKWIGKKIDEIVEHQKNHPLET